MMSLAAQLAAIPAKPGVYQMKDKQGHLLYVGKAKRLKARVQSYFKKGADHSPRIQSMVGQVSQIEVIVTNSEVEALLLESNLIKEHHPKYNILLRDDKKYPWLVLTNEPYPRLEMTREPHRWPEAHVFGPYASPGALYHTLQLIKSIFPLRQRKKPLFKDRPCMNYHIGTCLGPCQALISEAEYEAMVEQVTLFLKGQGDHLIAQIQAEMEQASDGMDYEKAAVLKKRLAAVDKVLQHQRVIYQDETIDLDAVGMIVSGHVAYAAVLKVRRGKLIQTAFFDVSSQADVLAEEVYQSFLTTYYQEKADLTDLPSSVALQYTLDEEGMLLQEWLSHHKGKKVTMGVPQRGNKKELVVMATRNAEESRERAQLEQATRLKHDPVQALLVLQERLGLPQIPRRIECYDVSHMSGTHTVASMVVFTDGQKDKKEYRRFRVKSVAEGKPDDFQSMLEVMTRRFSQREEKGWPDPDLIIIDGGKGQLSSAKKALEALAIVDQPIVSLAKKFEEVFVPGQSRPLVLPRNSMALFLFQQIRDEAHRFAISYHRRLRSKATVQSALDGIQGVGPARKKKLLEAFGSIQRVQQASVQELEKVLGLRGDVVAAIHQALQQSEG